MLKNKVLALVIINMVVFSGCGYRQITTQQHDIGFLKFTKGSSNAYTVLVNEKHTIDLGSCVKNESTGTCQDLIADSLYEVQSGKTTIGVMDKTGKLILQKEVYVGSSNTVEVSLP